MPIACSHFLDSPIVPCVLIAIAGVLIACIEKSLVSGYGSKLESLSLYTYTLSKKSSLFKHKPQKLLKERATVCLWWAKTTCMPGMQKNNPGKSSPLLRAVRTADNIEEQQTLLSCRK